MNIDLWQAVLAVLISSGMVAAGSRWWFGRRLCAVQRQHDKLDANHQTTLRMMSQTRKQVDDLQRLVSEYRRKLTALELERRRARVALEEALEENDAPANGANGLAAMRVPGGWADTQPL